MHNLKIFNNCPDAFIYPFNHIFVSTLILTFRKGSIFRFMPNFIQGSVWGVVGSLKREMGSNV